MPFVATQMDLETITLSELREKNTDFICYHLYVESKIWHKLIHLWNWDRLTKSRLMVAKGDGEWGRDGVGSWG